MLSANSTMSCDATTSQELSSKHFDKDDDNENELSFVSDMQSESQLIEIGPPKFLKYQTEYDREYRSIASPDQGDSPDSFFSKELKQYQEGGFDCDFCQAKTIAFKNNNVSDVSCIGLGTAT